MGRCGEAGLVGDSGREIDNIGCSVDVGDPPRDEPAWLDTEHMPRSGPNRRFVTAVETERGRVGMGLHNGVQQRLTALRIRLAMAADRFQERGDAEAAAALREFGDDVERAIDDVREFTRGVHRSARDPLGADPRRGNSPPSEATAAPSSAD